MNNFKLISEDQKLAFCSVAISPIRSEKTDVSEISSQLLFGEPIEILEFGNPWIKIRSLLDGYEGFIDIKQALAFSNKELKTQHIEDQQKITKLVVFLSYTKRKFLCKV